MLHRISISSLFFFCISLLFSQKAEKWQIIPDSDLKMTVYPEDSSAKAVVLQDIGVCGFSSSASRYRIAFNRHRRIKIFDKSAFDNGNISLPYYNEGKDFKLIDLDVFVYTPDGKKNKVKTDNIYNEEVFKNYWVKKYLFQICR